MKYFISERRLQTITIKSIFGLISFALVFVFGFLLGSSFNETNSKIHLTFSPNIQLNPRSSTNNQQSIKSSSYEYNSTHLWSIRLADENYFRLAHLLPCRIVEYSGGPNLYGACNSSTPDCVFLPITNYSIPSKVDGNQTIKINANIGYWLKPICPFIFQNRIFNWYHAQLLFYLMRYKPETLAHAQNTIAQYFKPPSIDLHHPYIAVYGRRSDKVRNKEMSQAYTLKQYSDLFDADARRTNIKTIYINSEDENVFNEFV
ncbi:unnamed protein product [Rotaria sordida]|uniref:Uncharacterized protein n=1 Tax=Rotaria sordida TaxID=392033 RepID=A0A814Q7M2_9BILA|nr:unnamed protein product [Rotaria sordida]